VECKGPPGPLIAKAGGNKMYTYDTDIAADCELQSFLTWLKKHDATFEVLEIHGPAGGNPLVRITSKEPMTELDRI